MKASLHPHRWGSRSHTPLPHSLPDREAGCNQDCAERMKCRCQTCSGLQLRSAFTLSRPRPAHHPPRAAGVGGHRGLGGGAQERGRWAGAGAEKLGAKGKRAQAGPGAGTLGGPGPQAGRARSLRGRARPRGHAEPVGVSARSHAAPGRSDAQRPRWGGARAGGRSQGAGEDPETRAGPAHTPRPAAAWLCVPAVSD